MGGCTTPKNARNMGFSGQKHPGISMKKIRHFPRLADMELAQTYNQNICSILRNYRFSIICAAIINAYTTAAHI